MNVFRGLALVDRAGPRCRRWRPGRGPSGRRRPNRDLDLRRGRRCERRRPSARVVRRRAPLCSAAARSRGGAWGRDSRDRGRRFAVFRHALRRAGAREAPARGRSQPAGPGWSDGTSNTRATVHPNARSPAAAGVGEAVRRPDVARYPCDVCLERLSGIGPGEVRTAERGGIDHPPAQRKARRVARISAAPERGSTRLWRRRSGGRVPWRHPRWRSRRSRARN